MGFLLLFCFSVESGSSCLGLEKHICLLIRMVWFNNLTCMFVSLLLILGWGNDYRCMWRKGSELAGNF